MMAFILRIPVGGQSREATVKTLRRLIGPISSMTGCLSCCLYQGLGEQSELMLYQLWESEQTLQAHLRSETCRRLVEVVETAGVFPKIDFYDITKSRGIEFIEAIRLTG